MVKVDNEKKLIVKEEYDVDNCNVKRTGKVVDINSNDPIECYNFVIGNYNDYRNIVDGIKLKLIPRNILFNFIFMIWNWILCLPLIIYSNTYSEEGILWGLIVGYGII